MLKSPLMCKSRAFEFITTSIIFRLYLVFPLDNRFFWVHPQKNGIKIILRDSKGANEEENVDLLTVFEKTMSKSTLKFDTNELRGLI